MGGRGAAGGTQSLQHKDSRGDLLGPGVGTAPRAVPCREMARPSHRQDGKPGGGVSL